LSWSRYENTVYYSELWLEGFAMPKFLVEIIASYPCTIEAKTMEEAFEIAENCPWEDWPDDDCEIVEYCAELVIEEEAEQVEETPKSVVMPIKQRPKLTLVKE
jgi:hypothetical protein